jgi:hypothetical protein
MIPALSLHRNGASPAIVGTSLPDWALGCSSWRERVARFFLETLELTLKSIGVTGTLVLGTFVAVGAVCLSLLGANMLVGYEFSENIFSFLWEYRSQDWGWRYGSEGRLLAGYFGLLLGAIILYVSPYLLWGLPLAGAVEIFHWLDRPSRRRRMREGMWSGPLVDDPASLGELKIEFSKRLPLGSPQMRSRLAKIVQAAAVVLTATAYFLLVIVLKDLILAVPLVVWILLLTFGFSVVAIGVLGLVVGFVLNCIVPVLFVYQLLDGERPVRALRSAFRGSGRR